jgi:hypothetical protein
MKRTLTIILASTLARIAAADSGETADQALKRGQAAYKAGRVHEACDAYATSDKLSTSLDTEQMLASCYEQDGKPVTAAKLYRSIADKADRKAMLAKATKLEANAPRLRFAINPMPAGIVVKVDGVEVSATEDVPVDLGPHEVTASAPGYAGHASAPADRDHAIVDVILRLEPRADAAPAPAPAPAPAISTSPAPAAEQPAPAPMSTSSSAGAPMAAMPEHDDGEHRDHRRRNGIIAAAVGGAVLVGSAVMYGLAESKFDDEHSLCPDSKCANNSDLAKANSLLTDARTYRDIGIGTSIGGGLILIAGGYLLLAPHHEDSHVSLSIGHDAAGMAYTGRF